MAESDDIADLSLEDLRHELDAFEALCPGDERAARLRRELDRIERLTQRLRFVRRAEMAIRRELAEPWPPALTIGFFVFNCPISTEARYARSRGRYGRHRGEDADSAPLNAKRPSWSWSAERKTARQSSSGRNRTPILGGSPLTTQAASAAGPLAGARLRAPAIQNRGVTSP